MTARAIDPAIAARLPAAGDRRLAVRVTRDALRQLRGGSPWLYDGSITSVSHDGAAGDLAVVFDDKRKFAAIGLWDPTSPIRLKVLHHGAPERIDAAWFSERIAAARRLRTPLLAHADPARIGYRAVNGENDGLPGLVVDVYAGVAVVKLYTPAWLPHVPAVLAGIVDVLDPRAIVTRLARSLTDDEIVAAAGLVDGTVVLGSLPPGPVVFDELGLHFEADVRHGQKTGYFLDQRANRSHVAQLASGKRVLDVFASTGGFTVHAAAGGATSVHAVDLSAPTLAVAERNLDLNRDLPAVVACTVTTEVADAFDAMGRLGRAGERFDIVVVDPPSFAQRAATVGRARAAYAKLTRLAMGVVEAGGVLVQASCSSRVPAADFFDTVTTAAADHGAHLTELRRTGPDVDHPVTFDEGAYLKAGFWRVEPGERRTRRRR